MTIKEHFEQALTLNKRINSKLDHLAALRSLATKASTTLSDMPRGSSRNVHRLEDIISKMMDLETEIDEEIDQFIDLKRVYMQIIGGIENPIYQLVMEQRYLCCRTWDEISEELGYELRWLHRLHGRALQDAEKVLQFKTDHSRPL